MRSAALGDVGLARRGPGRDGGRRRRRRSQVQRHSGTLGSRGGALGGDVDGGGARGRWARAVGGAGDGGGTRHISRNQVFRGRVKEEGNIWGGILSRVKPLPRTKGPFIPGGGFTRDKRGGLFSRVVAPPGTKGVFGRAEKIPSPRPTFSPGWIYHSGQKGPVFPHSRQILCFVFVSFYFSFKIDFHLLI